MKLATELQNEAKDVCRYDDCKERFLDCVKECFRTNRYAPIRINVNASQLWFPKSKEWIEVPSCFKADAVNILGSNGFIIERHFEQPIEHIIVKLF